MATASITATLNGGDLVTPKNDLIFKIYGSTDGYTTPIKTTGSHTSDADVTVTGDSVTINNVNVGAETLFKITALDAAANESIKSDAYDTATPEINYTFDGTTIDTGEWTVTNPNNTVVGISQNDKLIMTKLDGSAEVITARTNSISSVKKFSSGTFEFDYFISSDLQGSIGAILYNSTDTLIGGILSPSSSPFGKIRIYSSGGANQTTAEDYSSPYVRFKLIYNGSTIDFYYDKGAGYVSLGEYAAVLGDVSMFIYGVNGSQNGYTHFDNLKITDYVLA